MTAHRQTTLPARIEGLVARDLGDEIVVLNPRTQEAHRLTDRDAEAWRKAGETTSDELLLMQAARLQAIGLLEANGMSRRQLLARAGMVAAAAPMVSLALPMVQAAASVFSVTVQNNQTVCTPSTHTVTSIQFTFTASKQAQTINFTFSNPPGGSLTGPGLTSTVVLGNSSGSGSGTATGSLTAPSTGTFTVQWTATSTAGGTTSGTTTMSFC